MRPALLAFLTTLLLTGTPAGADQTDPRLDELFERLQATEQRDQAGALQAQIWYIRYLIDDAKSREIMGEGLAALSQGRYDDAVEVFTRLIEREPDYAEAWNRRATTYYLMGRYEDSLSDIEKVLELEPRHFGALAGKGLCLKALGRQQQAIDAFEAALEVNPHMEHVQLELIRIRHQMNQEI